MLKNFNINSHATLIIESRLCDLKNFITVYKTSLNVVDDDFIIIDGNKEAIKKEYIEEIMARYKLSSFNNSKKLYVILNISNSSKQTLNALLKFLEDPPNEVYALLTCKDINNVLPTITSRCQQIKLNSDYEKFNQICEHHELNEQQILVAKNIYFDLNEFESDLRDNSFISKYKFAKDMVTNHKNIYEIKILFDNFKKLSYLEISMILKMINVIGGPNATIIDLIDNIKFNPSRTLLFNKVWESLNI